MTGPLRWLPIFVPQLTLFVFMGVCVVEVCRRGGPYLNLLSLVPIFAVTVHSIRVVIGRLKCS